MYLKFITCSGANEHTEISGLCALSTAYPKLEWGIQVSDVKCAYLSSRWWWLSRLHRHVEETQQVLNLALHINLSWVEDFTFGTLSTTLDNLLSWKNVYGDPFFSRVQLNFKIGRERKKPDIRIVENRIKRFAPIRFILSYNTENEEFIKTLYGRNRIHFDCLYDNSFGQGLVPQERQAPVFKDVLQGYAGGLSSDNIIQELEHIALIVPNQSSIYIDAQGKLEGNDGHLSLEKCKTFLENIQKWEISAQY